MVQKNKNSVRLLNAVQGAIIESAGCLTLGLVRPAIFSIRIQLELLVAWVYFEDHAVEWSRVESGKDFPMRSFYLRYMHENGHEFSGRMKLLEAKMARKKEDPYGILSIFVHSTSPYSAPQIGPLAALVFSSAKCDECVELQKDVAEYLTDILASWHASKWHDLPEPIRLNMAARLTPKELSTFCK